MCVKFCISKHVLFLKQTDVYLGKGIQGVSLGKETTSDERRKNNWPSHVVLGVLYFLI